MINLNNYHHRQKKIKYRKKTMNNRKVNIKKSLNLFIHITKHLQIYFLISIKKKNLIWTFSPVPTDDK